MISCDIVSFPGGYGKEFRSVYWRCYDPHHYLSSIFDCLRATTIFYCEFYQRYDRLSVISENIGLILFEVCLPNIICYEHVDRYGELVFTQCRHHKY
jgi:hypothetical protein